MDEIKKMLGNELFEKVVQMLNGKSIIIDNGMLIPKHRFDCINISLREHKHKVQELILENSRLNLESARLSKLEKQCELLCGEKTVLLSLLKENILQQYK